MPKAGSRMYTDMTVFLPHEQTRFVYLKYTDIVTCKLLP